MSVNTFSPMLKTIARKVLLPVIRRHLRYLFDIISKWKINWHLAGIRRKVWKKKPGYLVKCQSYIVSINDGPNFYVLYKDIFINHIYHFEAQRSVPLILDCGSNIGISILYFKHVYPKARVIGFEPDPVIFPYLQENVTRNRLSDVHLVQAALAGRKGTLTFYADGKYGSCLAEYLPEDVPQDWQEHKISCVLLRDYLTEPVDFLKMNIEGAE